MIKFNNIIENDEYRERVIKFFRLPIRLSVSKDKFLSDLQFIKDTDVDKYNMIIDYTEKDFNKSVREQVSEEPDFTMESILEPILEDIRASREWSRFIEEDNSGVLEDYNGITSTHGFYNEVNDGKNFVSFDLKSANWQSLQSILKFNDSYEDTVKKYTDNLIPPVSKAFRTKITGVLGAKKIMDYNQKLLNDNKSKILNSLLNEVGIDLTKKPIFAFYADEFLIEIDDRTLGLLNHLNLRDVEGIMYESTGVNVHIRPFTLKWLGVNKACAKVHQDDFDILNISKDILLIMNKLMMGIEVKEIDYEGIKLKDKTKEEFIKEIKAGIKLIV